MKHLVNNSNNLIVLNRIILLICIFTVLFLWTGCHRKVGIKPGGQIKKDTSKCKCKKRKSIYSNCLITNPSDYQFNHSSSIG